MLRSNVEILIEQKKVELTKLGERLDSIKQKYIDTIQSQIEEAEPSEIADLQNKQLEIFKEIHPTIYRIRVIRAHGLEFHGFFENFEKAQEGIEFLRTFSDFLDIEFNIIPRSTEQMDYELLSKLNHYGYIRDKLLA